MVEKIIINPNKVRGYGNIISPHSSSDYELEDCTIATGTDTVNGATETVYTLTPTFSHSYSLAFGSASYTATGGSCTVTVTLTDNSTPVENATISVTGGTGGSGSGTTNSSGVASINVTGVTASGTLTASFQSATATASVTYASYLFYDDCSSSSGLSNYGSVHKLGNVNANGTLSYDSTMNAYKFAPTNACDSCFLDIPIPTLDNQDSYYIEAEFYTEDTTTGGQSGLVLYPSSDTGGNGAFFRDIAQINRCGVLKFTSYSENGEAGNSQQSGLPVGGNWYKLRLEISGTSVVAKWLKTDNTQVYSYTYTVPYTSSTMRVGLAFLGKSTSKAYYVRNIKATSTAPVSSYNLTFSQSTYTCDMTDGVTVSCTLNNGNTPVSGATITLSWEYLGSPQTVNITTNSSGVATHTFDYFDFESFPATLTATYSGATATCTINAGSGGGDII